MLNQELLDCVKRQIEQGVSTEQIRSSLLANGWQEGDINEAFVFIASHDNQPPPPPPTAQPASPLIPQSREINQPNIAVVNMTPQKEKFPIGMIVILFLIGLGFVTTLLGVKKPMLQLGPLILNGFPAILYSLVVAVVLGASFYGILKRKMWGRKLIIGWYLISLGLLAVNFISFLTDKQNIVRFYKESSPASAQLFTESVIMGTLLSALVIGWIIGLIIIFYIYRKRDFFKN